MSKEVGDTEKGSYRYFEFVEQGCLSKELSGVQGPSYGVLESFLPP